MPPSRPPAPLTPVLYPTLQDAWSKARPFTLNGWFERNGFSPGWTAALVTVAAFLIYQVVGAVVTAVGAIAGQMSEGGTPDMQQVLESLEGNAGLLLSGNAIGQFVGFGLVVWMVTRLHTRQVGPFLRLSPPDGLGVVLSVLGWIVLIPGLMWIGSINQLLPQPEFLTEMEQMQMDLIETALTNSNLSALFLLAMMALTPAICEELLFRGYLQRQVERKFGLVWSIVGVGLIFGLYHLRLTQLAPLALLGMYLGYITWATGSLGTAMLVHFLNNGLAVMASVTARDSETFSVEDVEALSVPWYLGLASLVAVAGVILLLHRRREVVVGSAPDAVPVPSDLALLPDS